jgi:hypothetical protein
MTELGDGCPICGTAVKCACRGRGYPVSPNRIDHEEHYDDGTIIAVYEDGSEEVVRQAADERGRG